ncbi:MAG: hypothetical protein CM1200mP18_10630 [Gammaproteobacteria bacterium]|nr:MAG: hypothetical protein CM1200mP18_10630 [Gammaproteobacteria bacterium]
MWPNPLHAYKMAMQLAHPGDRVVVFGSFYLVGAILKSVSGHPFRVNAQPNDYSFDLKHRLVGAAVLIVAAVIVLPLVLTGQKQGHRHALIGNGGASVPIQQTFISRIEVDNPDVFAQQNSAETVNVNLNQGKSPIPSVRKDVKGQGIDDNRPVTDSVDCLPVWGVRVGVFQIPENAKKRQSLLRKWI